MKSGVIFLSVLGSSLLYAYDTYILRLSLKSSDPDVVITYNFKGKGDEKNSGKQPFLGTYILPGGTTEYQRLKITPKDKAEEMLIKARFNNPDIELERVYRTNEYGEPILIEDHRNSFPNDNYFVKRSS